MRDHFHTDSGKYRHMTDDLDKELSHDADMEEAEAREVNWIGLACLIFTAVVLGIAAWRAWYP